MYEKIEICPCCNSRDFTNHLICDDYSVSKESFAIIKCTNCGFLLTSPRPDQTSISKYYQSDDYISHTNKSNNLTNFIYKVARNFTLKQKYKLINALTDNQTILDYGSGSGVFLNYLKKKNWQTFGIETDAETRQNSANEFQLDVYPNLKELPNKKFGIITLWHVLEHVHDLSNTLNTLHQLLTPDGRIVIAVPNYDSYDRKFYKEYWAAYDVPRHLYHFNQQNMKDLMKYHQFEFVKSHPQKLDSFYVSLLSENYRKGKFKFLKAFLIGWLSNRWARKNNNNYSSLIYIFKKA